MDQASVPGSPTITDNSLLHRAKLMSHAGIPDSRREEECLWKGWH